MAQSDAFVYKLAGNKAIPSRDFVFKDASSKKDHQLLYSPVYTLDKQRNLYITIKLVKGKNDGASIVWMSPQ